jgi:hypothetical protein
MCMDVGQQEGFSHFWRTECLFVAQ